MSLKKIIPVFLMWFATIAFGFVYNEYMGWYYYDGTRYLANVIVVAIMCALWVIMARLGGLNEKNTNVTALKFVVWNVIATVMVTALESIGAIGASPMILCVLFYPPMALCIRECTVGKHSRTGLTVSFVALMTAMYYLNGLKMMAFTGLVFLLVQAVAICTLATAKKTGRWIHWGLMLVGFAAVVISMVMADYSLRERVLGMAQPENVEQYSVLLDWFEKCKMFDFNPSDAFLREMKSPDAATYAHLMVCFGVVPTIIFIMLKAVTLAYMWRLAEKFKNPSGKFAAMASTGLISLNLMISVLSSFLRIPLTEFGAPFVTITGIGYCVVALAAYSLVFFKEYAVAEKNTEKTDDCHTPAGDNAENPVAK